MFTKASSEKREMRPRSKSLMLPWQDYAMLPDATGAALIDGAVGGGASRNTRN